MSATEVGSETTFLAPETIAAGRAKVVSDPTSVLETAAAWLLGILWVLPLVYAIWTAFHPPEYSTRFVLSAPWTLANFVNAWHAAGVANGGTTCEDPPGLRDNGMGKLYLAYLRDPDGNKICAIHRM